jgi:hypothetical protein
MYATFPIVAPIVTIAADPASNTRATPSFTALSEMNLIGA